MSTKKNSYRILYFSGTGNTAYVARELCAMLNTRPSDCEKLNLDKVLKHSDRFADENKVREMLAAFIGDSANLVLAYPVYAADMPWVIRRVLAYLPEDGAKRNLAVVCTLASKGDDACFRPFAALDYSRWQPHYAGYIEMPNNFKVPPFNFFHVPDSEEEIRSFQSPVDARIKEICALLTSEQKQQNIKTSGVRFFGPMQWLTSVLLRWVFGRIFATDACSGCGKCAAGCPTGNITLNANRHPEFGKKCCFCMRCYSFCPEKAICIGKKSRDSKKYPRYKGFPPGGG